MPRLTQFLSAARNDGYDIPMDMTGRQVRDKATDGKFPVIMIGQVYHFAEGDLAVIAEAMGLKREITVKQAA